MFVQNSAEAWWKQMENNLKRFKNLSVVLLKMDGDIERLLERSMSLQCNISDGELTMINDEQSIAIQEERYKEF
jgi:uncharacterized protein YaeQ